MKKLTTLFSMALVTLMMTNCQLGGGAQQNDIEAATDGMLETISADSSDMSGNGAPADDASLLATLGPVSECADASSKVKTINCDDANGSAERSVELIGCEITGRAGRVWSGDGLYEISLTGGAVGMCDADATVIPGVFVMGPDPVYVRQTNPDVVWTRIDTNNDVTVTSEWTRTEEITSAVDGDIDGIAESATSVVTHEGTFSHVRNGKEIHRMEFESKDGDFTSEKDDGTSEVINVSSPTTDLTFDENGNFTGRTVNGDYLVKHFAGGKFYHYTAVDLQFSPDTCGPIGGTLKLIAYNFDSDSETIGEQIGTWEGTFDADSDLTTVTTTGEGGELRIDRLSRRPCAPE